MKVTDIIFFIIKAMIMMIFLIGGLYVRNVDYVIIALLVGILCKE